MQFTLGCELDYHLETPTTFIFNIQPAQLPQQRIVSENLVVTPNVPVESYVMPESGNRYIRLTAPAGLLKVVYDAVVELDVFRADQARIAETPISELPFATLPHLYASRYSEADRLTRAATTEFGELQPGHERVTAICNWIHNHVAYEHGSSNEHTSATDTLIDRAGVCRDFAHLGIALCRTLGIPARFVSCYAWQLQPSDFHAVFEAWLGDRWYLFDGTRQAPLDGLVRIGVGRDAGEVAFATIYGEVEPLDMQIHIAAVDPVDETLPRTLDAISTSAI